MLSYHAYRAITANPESGAEGDIAQMGFRALDLHYAGRLSRLTLSLELNPLELCRFGFFLTNASFPVSSLLKKKIGIGGG